MMMMIIMIMMMMIMTTTCIYVMIYDASYSPSFGYGLHFNGNMEVLGWIKPQRYGEHVIKMSHLLSAWHCLGCLKSSLLMIWDVLAQKSEE